LYLLEHRNVKKILQQIAKELSHENYFDARGLSGALSV
jgi:hypothetical protein